MRRLKKMFVVFLLSFSLSTPLYANMPVIDISAIAQGVTQFMTTVEQYTRQIQQWKSEYDRLVKAAKSIASGDFTQIMSGISSFTSQLSGWSSTNKYTDAFLHNIGDLASNASSLYKMSQNMGQTLGNSWKWMESIKNPTDIWSALDLAGDLVGNVSSSIARNANVISRYTSTLADAGTTLAALETQAFGVSEKEIEAVDKQIEAKRKELAEAEQDLAKAHQDAGGAGSNGNETPEERSLSELVRSLEKQLAALEKQAEYLRDSERQMLDAKKNAEKKVNERLNEMASAMAGNKRDEETASGPSNYLKAHSYGSFE